MEQRRYWPGKFGLLILLSISEVISAPVVSDTMLRKAPLKVKGTWPSSALFISEYFVLFEDTTGVTHRISRILNAESEPEGYVSHIETPVCSDTLCNLMDIRMFWTLSGSYWGFDTIPQKPLTKNDHLKFDAKDYEKLHEMLLDEQSILRRRHKDDLFDKQEKRISQTVDAVTGATAKEVKEVVVDGAVYSSYTIYHLVHSQLAGVIKNDLKVNLFDALKERLSRSEKVDERVFFTKELRALELGDYADEVLKTVLLAVPRDRLYIMKKMPSEMWESELTQVRIAKMTGSLDIHSLSHFLNQLKNVKVLYPESLLILSDFIPSFSLNQLKIYLSLLGRDEKLLEIPRLQNALRSASENPEYQHRAFLSPFVKQT